jgi:hypothetical protein
MTRALYLEQATLREPSGEAVPYTHPTVKTPTGTWRIVTTPLRRKLQQSRVRRTYPAPYLSPRPLFPFTYVRQPPRKTETLD